jgi:hypothetical protein
MLLRGSGSRSSHILVVVSILLRWATGGSARRFRLRLGQAACPVRVFRGKVIVHPNKIQQFECNHFHQRTMFNPIVTDRVANGFPQTLEGSLGGLRSDVGVIYFGRIKHFGQLRLRGFFHR